MTLSTEHQQTLSGIAKWAIRETLLNGKASVLPGQFIIDEALKSKSGAFVSVYVKNDLRGCIGTFSETDELYRNVWNMAVQAAFEDRRFKPVTQDDLPNMKIELSILTPRTRIHGPEDIVIGKHGIYMILGMRRATLLPQVATRNNWDALRFLECCAENKLGMYRDSWKEAELYTYEAIIIS